MPPRATRKRKALAEVNSPNSNEPGTSQFSQEEYSALIQDMIDNIDRAGTCLHVRVPGSGSPATDLSLARLPSPFTVEEKIHEINQATKNAVASLNTNLKTRLVRLPKALKMMPLEELSGSAKKESKPVARKGASKRAVTKRDEKKDENDESRGAEDAEEGFKAPPPPPKFDENNNNDTRENDKMLSPPVQFSRAKKRAATLEAAKDCVDDEEKPQTSYNGVPLQTPMPFVGKAVPMPIQMLTVQAQGKRAGGKTKASRNAPQAAVITTKDGKQWAIGASGLRDIPESHRQEVTDMLRSQWAFLQDALRL